MLRLTVLFAFVLAFATCALTAPTPLVTPAPSVALEERDVIEARAAKKKTTTTKKKVTTTQKKAAAPTQKLYTTSSYSGQATWFTQDGNPGSCGKWNNDNTPLVALNQAMVNSMGNKCNSYVTIRNSNNGKTVRAVVADTCPGCGWGSLDLSLGAFKAIGDLNAGVLPITWSFS
ncbi:hypothetical protein JCM11491_005273 [Sporobolomyces phaffii]